MNARLRFGLPEYPADDLLDLQEDGEIFEEQKTFAQNYGWDTAHLRLQSLAEETKRVLIENFPASDARSCLIQLTDYIAERKS